MIKLQNTKVISHLVATCWVISGQKCSCEGNFVLFLLNSLQRTDLLSRYIDNCTDPLHHNANEMHHSLCMDTFNGFKIVTAVSECSQCI